ncbi:hypothetical protein BVC80_8729g15 [Macleaya cordata]|uniref:Uncharacterized protein n=1 Tax=Macleaya cordata TaxID=56857 RepID=A0A200Q8D7_MACCD|nr:hypothetical protein BVC80_8729g15 [Macleaya cordata]
MNADQHASMFLLQDLESSSFIEFLFVSFFLTQYLHHHHHWRGRRHEGHIGGIINWTMPRDFRTNSSAGLVLRAHQWSFGLISGASCSLVELLHICRALCSLGSFVLISAAFAHLWSFVLISAAFAHLWSFVLISAAFAHLWSFMLIRETCAHQCGVCSSVEFRSIVLINVAFAHLWSFVLISAVFAHLWSFVLISAAFAQLWTSWGLFGGVSCSMELSAHQWCFAAHGFGFVVINGVLFLVKLQMILLQVQAKKLRSKLEQKILIKLMGTMITHQIQRLKNCRNLGQQQSSSSGRATITGYYNVIQYIDDLVELVLTGSNWGKIWLVS